MDEIFDHIKHAKLKHKYLAGGLVVTEIIGIAVLVWYLRTPLTQKFLATPPKAYSIQSYNPAKRYLVKQGDYLQGKKALPNSKIAIFLTPGNTKTLIKADNKGEFLYRLPEDTKPGRFRVTFANFDALKNLAWVKSYKITVGSNNIFYNFPLLKNLRPKQAQAKEVSFNFVD